MCSAKQGLPLLVPQKKISPLPSFWHCEQMKVVFLLHLVAEQRPCCVYVVATFVPESVFLNRFRLVGVR